MMMKLQAQFILNHSKVYSCYVRYALEPFSCGCVKKKESKGSKGHSRVTYNIVNGLPLGFTNLNPLTLDFIIEI